jgi:uncharacterized membrane protein YedE/YeeE
MREITALFCGLVFGIGLAMSGMTDTAKVQGFLDLFGEWIPDLALVMGGAVAVTVIAFRLVLRRERPVLGGRLALPGTTVIDSRLLGGAAVFGVGWGLYGYCPGPALSALVYLDWRTGVFVVTMLVGMAVANRITQATP